MKPSRCILWASVFALAALPLASSAQSAYPTRAVRLIVNFPPGGVGDLAARVLSHQLTGTLGQPFVVDNRSGANGNIGAAEVVRAAPDGYTLLLSPSGVIAVNGWLYPGLQFDPMNDLDPVVSMLAIRSYLLVPNTSPAKTLKEFIELGKAQSGKLNYGTAGSGSSYHLAAELLKREAGVAGLHIPYKGAAPALNALLAGEVDYMFDSGPGLQHVKTGRLRMLAVASRSRDPRFPDVPTVSEVIGKDFDASTLFGLLAPAGTPASVKAVLEREIERAMKTPEMLQLLDTLSASPQFGAASAYSAQLKQINQSMGRLIKQNGITAD